MLAEDRHQSIEIDACPADLRGVGRPGSGILHDRSSFPRRRRPSSDASPWVPVPAGKDSRNPHCTHVSVWPLSSVAHSDAHCTASG
ncbi:hypothetical protein XAR_2668 [Xanthomonas citri pv. glycines str. 8ra]|nr:hypothetical protein XAR_2668 [Xanthomonas citri pv. glycines str. 8ra]